MEKVESWDGIYSIEAGSGIRINCLNFLPYGVLTTHTAVDQAIRVRISS